MIHNISRFIAALALLATAQTAWAQWTGSGTSADPYKISSVTDLAKIYTMVNAGTNYENVYFLQTADIDCSTLAVWNDTYGAGIGRDADRPFKGRYDGGGKKIKNLRITATNSQYAGLFGYIVGGAYQGIEANTHVAEVHDVVLVNPTITITATSSEQYAGAIVGYAGDCSQIYDNTVIGGTITYTGGSNYNTDNSYVGGIVARYGNSNLQRLSGNTVVGTSLSGAGISGGLVGFLNNHARFSGNFADASISGADFRTAGIKREGALVGYYNHYASSVTDVNYYHSASGLTAYGGNYTYSGSHSISAVADNAWVAPLYTVSGLPDGLTVSGTPTASHADNDYYDQGAVLTIGTGNDDKVFSDFTATGATASSLATDRRSATVTVGTADVTVSATLQTVSGTTADGLSWSLAQDDSGNYTRLTVGGNGAMRDYSYTTVGGLWRTTAPWGYGLTSVTIGDGVTAIGSYAFIGCQSLAAATIGSSVATIGQKAFDHCDALVTVTLPASVTTIGQGAFYNCIGLQRIDILHDGDVGLAANVFQNDNALQYITFPSPAALQANTTGNWSTHADKLRVTLGSDYLFHATATDCDGNSATPAYQIATDDDLRRLAAAVNAGNGNTTSGQTFRQTADIDLGGTNFPTIGNNGSNKLFKGTYDGQGFAIRGLSVSTDRGNAGLFGYIYGATLRGITLVQPSVTTSYTSSFTCSVGSIVGYARSSTIENCHALQPTVSATGTGSGEKRIGAIAGEACNGGNTLTNCYYYGGNAAQAIGLSEGANITRVCAAHLVTPADGVTIQTPMAPALGFTCDADNNGTAENYWRTGAQLTLGYTETVADGYTFGGYTATNGGTISGSTLTMPDADLAVAISLQAIPWSGSGTASDPYVIEYPSQLLLLAHRVNGTSGETADTYQGRYFKLGADITFSHDDSETDEYEENYEAIGRYDGSTYHSFLGMFDGDGHTVSGIRIRKTGTGAVNGNQGLFGRIDTGANIHDVHVTDARITGYENVGGIVGGIVSGTVSGCSVTDSYISANHNYGTIFGRSGGTLQNNYYHGCTVNGTPVTSGMGCYGSDIAANHGALPAYAIALGANITTPPGTFVGDGESFATPPVDARLDPENGFTLAGNHYFASGYEFTPGSTLASGAAQGYTPRATLGGQLLDLYTPTGDPDPLAGKAIARLSITADCDGKTLASTQAIYSTGRPVSVAYIKADGTTDEASAIALDGHETVDGDGDVCLDEGTYYVGTDITYANQIYLNGDVTLILANRKTMTLNDDTPGIINDSRNLTIYGQSLDDATAGTLRYNGTADGITVNNYEQYSGNVSITTIGSTIDSWVWGIDANAVTLRGGTLAVTTNSTNAIAIMGGTHSILGGQLTATATGTDATGIYASASSGSAITLGWTRPADRITVSSISTGEGVTVAVADGKALTDGSGNIYTGTLTAADLAAIGGKTLRPCLALADNADNATQIATLNGIETAAILAGRTLYKDGSWNTLCLPFDISTASGTLSGDNVQAMTLNTTTSNLADGTLTLNFDAATGQTIPAGTPFIIKWDESGTDITNPVFYGVTIDAEKHDATVTDVLTFTGTYAPVTIDDGGDNTKLYLGSANTLYYPTKAMTIGCHRAYFQLADGITAGEPVSGSNANQIRAFNLNFGDDEATGIVSAEANSSLFILHSSLSEWYTLDGRKLDKQPTQRGLYIHGGKKVVIK